MCVRRADAARGKSSLEGLMHEGLMHEGLMLEGLMHEGLMHEGLMHEGIQVLHTDDAHVRPPPNATIMNGLPFVIFPARHSSSRQSGTLPALELP